MGLLWGLCLAADSSEEEHATVANIFIVSALLWLADNRSGRPRGGSGLTAAEGDAQHPASGCTRQPKRGCLLWEGWNDIVPGRKFGALFWIRMQPVDYADVESRLSGSDNLSSKMHPFPCSALLTCFGNAHENTPFDQPNTSPLAMDEQKTEATSAVCLQPAPRAASSLRQAGEKGSEEMFKAFRHSEKHSRTNSSSSNHTAVQSASAITESSVFAANELSQDAIVLCTHIPRPSIIHVPKVSALEVAV